MSAKNKEIKKTKKVNTKGTLKNKKQFKIICLVISLLLGFTSILFDAFLMYVNVLPIKYLIPILLITNLFVFLFILVLIKRKFRLWIKFLSMFLSLILILIFSVGCFYINRTYDFMGKIRSKNILTEEYYVIVNKNSKIESINNLKNKTINVFDEGVDIYNQAIDKLNKAVKINQEKVDSVDKMASNLLDGEVDAILISAMHKDIVSEEFENFEESTKIIYTIYVEVKQENKVQNNNTNVKKDTFTVYVSGIDSYGDISTRSRSDVNMLVTVNPTTHQILLTSIPRDYYVQLHGKKGYKDKLTHAGVYGVDTSIQTIEDFMNIDIDFYVRVNFSTLLKVVDTLGGVDVYSDKAFRAFTNQSVYVKQGVNHMDGAMALAFARERYAYKEGDRHRIQNQQDVITAIIKKVTTSTTILTKYTTLLDQLSSSFETNIDTKDITSLIKNQIDKMPSWDIQSYSLNGSDSSEYTYSYGAGKLYVMIPNQKTIDIAHDYITKMENGEKIAIKEEDKIVNSNSNNYSSSNIVVDELNTVPSAKPTSSNDKTEVSYDEKENNDEELNSIEDNEELGGSIIEDNDDNSDTSNNQYIDEDNDETINNESNFFSDENIE